MNSSTNSARRAPTTRTIALATGASYAAFERALASINEENEGMVPWDTWKAYERFSAFSHYTHTPQVNVHVETLAGHLGYTSVYFSR